MARIIALFGLLLNLGGAEGSEKTSANTLSYDDVLNWSVSLLLVLAIFFLCVWILRKSGQVAANSKNHLSVIAGLSLGMREKVVLVKVGDKQLLLGVTPGRIDKLMELEGEDRLFQSSSVHDGGEFSRKLFQVMRGKSDE